jgi:hypothetical protein
LPRDVGQAFGVIDDNEVVLPACRSENLLDLLPGFVRIAGAGTSVADDMQLRDSGRHLFLRVISSF